MSSLFQVEPWKIYPNFNHLWLRHFILVLKMTSGKSLTDVNLSGKVDPLHSLDIQKDLEKVFSQSLEKFFDPEHREEFHRHGQFNLLTPRLQNAAYLQQICWQRIFLLSSLQIKKWSKIYFSSWNKENAVSLSVELMKLFWPMRIFNKNRWRPHLTIRSDF